ncbi:MAG: adenylate kinase [Bacilli bacterium]|nr:adenylate kinase [Bacilli bacterium]
MNKIIVIGCPGSGKSYFSKKLKDILNYPIYHLDLIWNKPDKTTISREEFDSILNKIFLEDTWIMDGNYQRTLEMRINACDTIILLDFDLEVSLEGATSRVGQQRDDMPWKEESLSEEFKNKILSFREEKLPEIYKLLDKYKDEKEIIIFKNREESNNYLDSLK